MAYRGGPRNFITLADENAFDQFCRMVACPDCPEEQLKKIWEKVRSGGSGEINVRTGELPSSLSESIATGIARGFNPELVAPYQPKPLEPGEVVVIWEQPRLSPSKVEVKVRRG